MIKRVIGAMVLALLAGAALAKLPPLSDEAKAKAAEAKAKADHANLVGAYELCQVQDRVAAAYLAGARKAGKVVNPVATPPCQAAPPNAAAAGAGKK